MIKTICFDFGNTRLKAAVFENEKFTSEIILPDDEPGTIEKILTKYNPEKTILSSVIDHHPGIEELLASQTKFHKVSHLTKTNFTTPVGKPQDIGADRLALMAAAVDLFPSNNNLIIGLGSAITYNFVNKFHEFLGGSISPGLEMRFKSMNSFTAKLPLVKADSNFPLIGYNTSTNLLSGVILGMSKEIDGFIDEYALRYSNFNVHLTGGDMGFFVPHLKNKIFADPQLIYKGLYAINKINQV